MRRRDLEIIKGHLSREIVLEFAVYTLINVHYLYGAAKSLIEKERYYGVGRSVAITALEELGKLTITLNYLANKISPEDFVEKVFSHNRKQNWGTLITTIAPIIDSLLKRLQESTGTVSNIKDIIQHMDNDPAHLEREFLKSQTLIVSRVESSVKGELEEQRQNGLYVSISVHGDGLKVIHPQMIGEEESKQVFALLSSFDELVSKSTLAVDESLNVREDPFIPENEALAMLKQVIDRMCQQVREYL